MGWNFPGRKPRIGRMPSNARRLQALSAIIESPRGGTPKAGSRNSPAATKGGAIREREIQSASVEPLIPKPETAQTASPPIPPRSSSRPIQLTDGPPPEPLTRELSSRPRAARSKSLGTVSDPNKPNSTNTFASAPGPAPTGPLPPLPPLPRNISRQSDYNPANRHSALVIPSAKHNDSTSTSLNSSPERNWERIVNSKNINTLPEFKNSHKPEETAAEVGAEVSSNGGSSRPASYIGHRRSLVCLSITSNGSNRNSVTSIASTLEKQANRLSIPQILNVDRISISRVSSSGSLSSGNGGVTMVTTPRRHTGSSRVSATGSPSEKPKVNILRTVSGNAGSPQRSMKSALRDPNLEAISRWEKSVIGPKHSILKGSPSARKGHRRQNCVRLSTLAPTVLESGGRSRSTSPSMDGIQEESPDRASGPVADKHLNGDVTLRPRTLDPLRLRASLTPSSPTLSMVAYQNEPLPWNSEVSSRRASYRSPGARSALSREASLFSIPSLPDLSHMDQSEDVQQGSETPAIQFTRPSTEWSEHERSPPFNLHVTPSNSKRSVYKPESSPPLPSWSNQYDPSWPMLTNNPPASGQKYNPDGEISVYSSDEEDSSSPNFPFAVQDKPAICSSPLSFLGGYDDEKENGGLKSPQSEEIESPYARAAAPTQCIRSPFESMPILRPHASFMEDLGPSLPSPPPSPNSSICKTPPLLCRSLSNISFTLASVKPSDPVSSATRQTHRNSSTSPRRRSGSSSPHRRSGGIEKATSRSSKRVTGPRAQPPKDIRKSIMALRRMNSSLQVSEEELGKGSHRYLHLGREASVQLPFDFGFSSDNEDDGPPRDILFEQAEHDESEDEGGSKECRFITYSPAKPTLSLLTTLPEANRTQLSVWENGEGYWAERESSVTSAITSSPVDTPTSTLDKMLGWQEETPTPTPKATFTPAYASAAPEQSLWGKGKAESEVLEEGEETMLWDRRKSKMMETPKSTRSLYDQQGFWISPSGEKVR